jgi:cbb3-type cytochrome oxidase cytochrome c subunit
MLRSDARLQGWHGAGLIAITYVYFLIFAQFAFLKRLAELGIADAHLKTVMGAMAFGGIAVSLLAPRLTYWPSPGLRIRLGLTACGVAALLTGLKLGLVGCIAVSSLIGCGLGLLTVTLVTHLRSWLGSGNPLLMVGLGTGTGYFICNFPPLFTTNPPRQAAVAAVFCLLGIFLSLADTETPSVEAKVAEERPVSFARLLICFTALVWFDSAAFFIIQNTPALKADTWAGSIHLWVNGALHFVAAVASVWVLRRLGLATLLSAAFLALATACLLLLDPHHVVVASALYPIGVSLYSVALVAYPSLLAPSSSVAERGRQAGWIYAIAGWFGSAMGIGMAQNLGHVPVAFAVTAAGLVLAPVITDIVRRRKREAITTVALLTVGVCVERVIRGVQPKQPVLSSIERGRHVYIAEGCINCHSQYVRPGTRDVLMWGPVQRIEELRREQPPLIGNRRQGPDLAEVGSRRSPLWLKTHFYDPSEVSEGSFMPSYGYLFQNRRGDDLVAYLESLREDQVDQHLAMESSWRPSPEAFTSASSPEGARLYHLDCSTCHDAAGATRRTWQENFRRLPPNLATGPFLHLSTSATPEELRNHVARIIKFGIRGTDMPGHEYFSDADIGSMSQWLVQNMSHPNVHHNNVTRGEKQ